MKSTLKSEIDLNNIDEDWNQSIRKIVHSFAEIENKLRSKQNIEKERLIAKI